MVALTKSLTYFQTLSWRMFSKNPLSPRHDAGWMEARTLLASSTVVSTSWR